MDGRLRIRTRRISGAPVVAVRVWLGAGERHAVTPGEALLAGRLLEDGTRTRDWQSIASDAEDRGISISAAGGYEVLGLGLDGPAGEARRMAEWAAELAQLSTLEEERWQWQRRLATAELTALADEPDVLTGWSFLRQLYGDHPRGRPLLGDAASLGRLTAEDSRRSYRRAQAAGTVVGLAGAIDEAEMSEVLHDLFARDGTEHEPLPEPVPMDGPSGRVTVELPGDQAHLLLGRLTVPRDHPDLPALELAGVVLGAGAGLAGRIPERVREREGLAYTVSVATAAGTSSDPGRLAIYAATSPARLERTELAVRAELERFVMDGPSPTEMTTAKSFLEGQELFRRETARQWAELLAEAEFTGIAVDASDWASCRWASLTAEDVRSAARSWLDPAHLCVTAGRPKS